MLVLSGVPTRGCNIGGATRASESPLLATTRILPDTTTGRRLTLFSHTLVLSCELLPRYFSLRTERRAVINYHGSRH
jgi:hypothetical protein